MRLSKTQYASKEELGREIQAKRPDLAGRDPVQLADLLLASPAGRGVTIQEAAVTPGKPTGYTDINPLRAAGNVPGDALRVIGENIEGVANLVAHPIDSAAGLAKVGAGAADVLAQKVGFGLDIAAPKSEAAARAMGQEIAESFNPEGLQERPMRALSNATMVMPLRGILGALSKAGQAGKYGRLAAKTGMVAEEVVNSPVGAALRGGLAVAGEAKGLASRTGRRISQATTGQPTGLGQDVLEAGTGFVTGKGEQSAHSLYGVARDAAQSRVFEDYRNRARPASGRAVETQDHIIEEVLRAHDRIKEASHKQHGDFITFNAPELDQPVAKAIKTLPGGGKIALMDNLRANLDGELSSWGVVLKQVGGNPPTPPPSARIAAIWAQTYRGVTDAAEWQRKSAFLQKMGLPAADFPEPPRWKVTWDEDWTDVPQRDIIAREVEKLANTPDDAKIRQLHMDRRELDKSIRRLDPKSPVAHVLKTTRASLSGTLREFIADPAFRQEMRRYEKRNADLELIEQELSIPSYRVLSKTGQIHWDKVDRSAIIGAIRNAWSESEQKHVVPEMLRMLQDEGGAQYLLAKGLGYGYSPMAPHGLVGRGRMAAAGAAGLTAFGTLSLAGVPTAVAAAAAALPTAVLYSPRFSSALILKLGDMKRNPGKVRRAAATIQARMRPLLSHPFAGPWVRRAMRESWSVGKLFESLQAQGVDVNAILEPEPAQPQPRKTLLRSLGTVGVPYAR